MKKTKQERKQQLFELYVGKSLMLIEITDNNIQQMQEDLNYIEIMYHKS